MKTTEKLLMIPGTILFILRFILFFVWFILMMFVSIYYRYCRKDFYGIKKLSYCARKWAWGSARIFGLKVKIHGSPETHSGLIISNHISYMDIMLLGSVFPLRFAPKDDIRTWPILGWLIDISNPIWINRSSKHASKKVLAQFNETLENGISLITFPEGTTSSGKSDLLPFKSTTFETAISASQPVYPVLIKYHDDSIAWYGDGPPLLLHAWQILSKLNIKADLYLFDPISPDPGIDRKEFRDKVYKTMNYEYQKLLKA